MDLYSSIENLILLLFLKLNFITCTAEVLKIIFVIDFDIKFILLGKF